MLDDARDENGPPHASELRRGFHHPPFVAPSSLGERISRSVGCGESHAGVAVEARFGFRAIPGVVVKGGA